MKSHLFNVTALRVYVSINLMAKKKKDPPKKKYAIAPIEKEQSLFEKLWAGLEDSSVGKFVDAKGLRKEVQHFLPSGGLSFDEQSGRDNLGWLPVAGEAADAASTIEALRKGEYTDAALYGTGLMIPFVPGGKIKNAVKPYIKPYVDTVKPYISNAKSYIKKGIDATEEVAEDTLKRLKKHGESVNDGNRFTEAMFYDPSTKNLRPEVVEKMLKAENPAITQLEIEEYLGFIRDNPEYTQINPFRDGTSLAISDNPLYKDVGFGGPSGEPQLLNSSQKAFLKGRGAEPGAGFYDPSTGATFTYVNKNSTLARSGEIAAHEGGHRASRIRPDVASNSFFDSTTIYDEKYGYYVAREDTESGRFFRKILKDPVPIPKGASKEEAERIADLNWHSSPDELHSEKIAAAKVIFNEVFRMSKESFEVKSGKKLVKGTELFKNFKKDLQERYIQAVRSSDIYDRHILQELEQAQHRTVGKRNSFFKKETSLSDKLKALKMFGITGAALFGGQQIRAQAGEEEFKHGGEVGCTECEKAKYAEGGEVEGQVGPPEPEEYELDINDADSIYGAALQNRKPKIPEELEKVFMDTPDRDREYIIEDFMTERYNTELSDLEMQHYALWMDAGWANPKDIGVYDIQGYWKSNAWKDNTDPDNHGSDTYKKPSHPTFSDESQYSAQKGGSEFIGGRWREDGGFLAGPDNMYTNDRLRWEFSREKNRPEYLYTGTPVVEVSPKDIGTQQKVQQFDKGGEVTKDGGGEEVENETSKIHSPVIENGTNIRVLQRFLNEIYPELGKLGEGLIEDGIWGEKTYTLYQKFKTDYPKSKGKTRRNIREGAPVTGFLEATFPGAMTTISALADDIFRKQVMNYGPNDRPPVRTEGDFTDDQVNVLRDITRKNLAAGKSYIDYKDYDAVRPSQAYRADSGIRTFGSLLGDPGFQTQSVLGRASIVTTPETFTAEPDTLVLDTYNFNNDAYSHLNRGGTPIDNLKEATGKALSPYGIVRNMAQYFGSQEGDTSAKKYAVRTNQ